jgi:hypothetical protein
MPYLMSFVGQFGGGKLIGTHNLMRKHTHLECGRSYIASGNRVLVTSPGRMGQISDMATVAVSPGPWTEDHIGPEAFSGDVHQILLICTSNSARLLRTDPWDGREPYLKRILAQGIRVDSVEWDAFRRSQRLAPEFCGYSGKNSKDFA